MIHTAPRTDVIRSGFVLALILVAGMTVGFVAGQVVPDVFGSLFGPSTTVTTEAPELTQNADYGIRHLALTGSGSQTDDYGIRHLTTTPLTPADDYGVRHLQSTIGASR